MSGEMTLLPFTQEALNILLSEETPKISHGRDLKVYHFSDADVWEFLPTRQHKHSAFSIAYKEDMKTNHVKNNWDDIARARSEIIREAKAESDWGGWIVLLGALMFLVFVMSL